MKQNTADLKLYLKKALISSPDDFNLQEVKVFISKALDIVEQVEKKRNLREQQKLNRQNPQKLIVSNSQNSLEAIEKELNTEKQKLEEIKNRRTRSKPSNNDYSNGLDYVFG
jgi:hypothetical protein